MNWLFWAADHLWTYYYQHQKQARAMQSLKHALTGAGLAVLSFLFGFSTLALLLLSSFCFFAEQPKFSLAALWTALICSALTLAIWLLGSRFFDRSVKA